MASGDERNNRAESEAVCADAKTGNGRKLSGKPGHLPKTVFVLWCSDAVACLIRWIAAVAPSQIVKRSVQVIGAASSAAL